MATRSTFRLKVRQVDRSCVFDLAGSDGQELSATLKYAEKLTELYQNWRQIYRKRYELRSRARVKAKGGSGTPSAYDWDRELKVAENALLDEFDRWLGQEELLEIRERIQYEVAAQTSQRQGATRSYRPVDLLLDCHPLDLARLPWETWKLAPKDTPVGTLRLARTLSPVAPPAENKLRHGKIRVLAIFGDAPDLDREQDRKAVQILYPVAEIEVIQCQLEQLTDTSKQIAALKRQIAEAIADERGWDVLFFAGHSDESPLTGGKLELAPNVSLSIGEIEPQLTIAKQRGLQLAIFNSCCGLHIAGSLIKLGLGQVVVMRERIQDAIAHVFLTQFCQNLVRHQDVHEALLEVCQYFASENISYPSAYLIPSLFRHPDPKAALFRIDPSRWKRTWQQWRPTRWEAISLGIISLLSLMTPVREILLEQRYLAQAIYRNTTQQLPPATAPLTLLNIDQESIDRRGINAYKVRPMSRAYLAELIERLQKLNVKVIGLDYLLDGSTSEDSTLAKVVRTAIQQHTWFVFASDQNEAGQKIGVTQKVARTEWILQGNVDIQDWSVMLPAKPSCREDCPFAYQLALAYKLHQHSSTGSPQPQLQSAADVQHQVTQYLRRFNGQDETLAFLKQPHLPLNLKPVIDFSLPPNRVYQQIAAWDFLRYSLDDPALKALQTQVVIIASGGYDQADDNFSVPIAIAYWRSIRNKSTEDNREGNSQVFSGGEAHAYTVHHLLSQHLVLWIPDLWIIGVAALLGKVTTLLLIKQKHQQRHRWVLCCGGATVFYWLIGLQTYISAAVLLPWVLPSAVFWGYILPTLKR